MSQPIVARAEPVQEPIAQEPIVAQAEPEEEPEAVSVNDVPQTKKKQNKPQSKKPELMSQKHVVQSQKHSENYVDHDRIHGLGYNPCLYSNLTHDSKKGPTFGRGKRYDLVNATQTPSPYGLKVLDFNPSVLSRLTSNVINRVIEENKDNKIRNKHSKTI